MALAERAVNTGIRGASRSGYQVTSAAVLLGSGKPIPSLEKILASHPLLHTAEGELFRNVIVTACESHELSVLRIREKELWERCSAELVVSEQFLQQHLIRMGKGIGPPWTQDEKLAALAAWLTLACT